MFTGLLRLHSSKNSVKTIYVEIFEVYIYGERDAYIHNHITGSWKAMISYVLCGRCMPLSCQSYDIMSANRQRCRCGN